MSVPTASGLSARKQWALGSPNWKRAHWLVLHDIITSDNGTNLDHLVIGPGGVFSLNTKHHPKAKVVVTERSFRVNGYRHNYLPVAVSEAAKVARVFGSALGVPLQVRPVIVVMAPSSK